MHICLLKNYIPAYPDASNYEVVRLLDEISKRGHTSSVVSLYQDLAQYQSYYSSRIAHPHLDTPQYVNEATAPALPTLPSYVTAKVDSSLLPDIFILRNSISPKMSVDYSLFFDNVKEAGTTVVNNIDQHVKMGSKVEVYRALEQAGVPIPKTIIIPRYNVGQEGTSFLLTQQDIEMIGDEVGFPCVIKLPYGYEGAQVDIALSAETLSETLNRLLEANSLIPVPEIIFQEHVPDSFHTYSAHIVGDFINADIRIGEPNNPDPFKASSMPGNMRFQYRVDSELESITKAALAAINLDFARFDFVKKNGQYLVLEANVSGTFTRTENCNRRNIAGALVDHAIAVHSRKN